MLYWLYNVAMVMLLTAGSAKKVAMVTAGEIFNLYTHSTKQIQQFKLSTLSLMVNILSYDNFTIKVSINSNNHSLIWS